MVVGRVLREEPLQEIAMRVRPEVAFEDHVESVLEAFQDVEFDELLVGDMRIACGLEHEHVAIAFDERRRSRHALEQPLRDRALPGAARASDDDELRHWRGTYSRIEICWPSST